MSGERSNYSRTSGKNSRVEANALLLTTQQALKSNSNLLNELKESIDEGNIHRAKTLTRLVTQTTNVAASTCRHVVNKVNNEQTTKMKVAQNALMVAKRKQQQLYTFREDKFFDETVVNNFNKENSNLLSPKNKNKKRKALSDITNHDAFRTIRKQRRTSLSSSSSSMMSITPSVHVTRYSGPTTVPATITKDHGINPFPSPINGRFYSPTEVVCHLESIDLNNKKLTQSVRVTIREYWVEHKLVPVSNASIHRALTKHNKEQAIPPIWKDFGYPS